MIYTVHAVTHSQQGSTTAQCTGICMHSIYASMYMCTLYIM